MALKTPAEYLESLKRLKRNVYLMGEKVDNIVDHPIIRPSINSVAMTYELAGDPEHEDLMTCTSSLTGEKINRFCHLHQSTDDLIKKVKMQRLMGQKTAACFQRCVGMDAFNALDSTTFEMDQKLGTSYHQRFISFLKYVQENDLVVDGAMTDVKGDRGLSPSQQADPDMYVHVVEYKDDGIVVSGAKAHQTGMLNSHEMIVMPTSAMTEKDKDYAVTFTIPTDAEGIVYIYGRQSCDTRRLEGGSIDVGNARFGGQEVLTVFDRVFVPWERVFMCGEWEFSGHAGRAVRGLPPPELRRVQGGGGRRADRGGGHGGRLQRCGQGLSRQGQTDRDNPSEREPVRVRDRLLGRGEEDCLGQLPDRHAAG